MSENMGRQRAIDLLISVEETAGNLYRRCARQYPEMGDLWRSMSMSEERHAQLLREIASDPSEAAGFCERRMFAVNPMRILLGELRRSVEGLDGPRTSILSALEVAREIENSVLERRVLDPLPGDSATTRQELEQLAADTADHRVLVDRAIAGLTG